MSPSGCAQSTNSLDEVVPEALALRAVQIRAGGFRAAALSPEGAAAPAAWQSQFRGPGLKGNEPLQGTRNVQAFWIRSCQKHLPFALSKSARADLEPLRLRPGEARAAALAGAGLSLQFALPGRVA